MTAAKSCGECGQPYPPPPEKCGEKFRPFVPHEEAVGVLGVMRSGKSRLVKGWLAHLMAQGVAVVVWDPKDEYSQRSKRVRDRAYLGPLKQRYTVPEFHAAYREDRLVLTRKDLSLSVVPSAATALDPKVRAAELRSVMRRIWGRGRCVFVVEECSQLQSSYGEALLVEIASVWPESVPSIFVAQTPTMLPKNVRANLTRYVCFTQSKASDRTTLARDVGAEFAASLKNLGRGEARVARTRPAWALTSKKGS